MSTIVSPVMNKDNPKCRLAIVGNARDFWDDTKKRWTSGNYVTDITNITWTGTDAAGEKLTITIQPPNYQPACNKQVILTPLVTADAWGGSAWKHVTCVNYGVPDPSAQAEADGSITLATVDLELPADTLSSSTATVTYTAGAYVTSPFTTLSSGTDYTSDLILADGDSAAWGMIYTAMLDATHYGAFLVQLTSLASTVVPGSIFNAAPQFQVAGVPQDGSPPLGNYSWPLPKSASRVLTLSDNYTYMVALNYGKVSAAATPLVAAAGNIYNLCNFGLTKDAGNGDTAKMTLGYRTWANTATY